MKKEILGFSAFLITAICAGQLYASEIDIVWEKTFGGTDDRYGYCVEQTSDNGFIIAGELSLFWNDEIYIIRTDSDGNEIWSNTFGGPENESGYSIQQTSDGGFIVSGYTYSFGAGRDDIYIVRIDSLGNEIWSETFGGPNDESGLCLRQISDGNFVIAGYTESYGAGIEDVYLIKIDGSGQQLWSKTFGGSKTDYGRYVEETTDGGFIIAGQSVSFGLSVYDAYLVRTDAEGNELWSKTFGGRHADYGYCARQTSDGGFVLTGRTRSFGDPEYSDVLFIKTDSSGNEIWTKTFGGMRNDGGRRILEAGDGGFIIAGGTSSFGAGGAYIIKTNRFGNEMWSDTLGSASSGSCQDIVKTSDGGFVVVGYKMENYDYSIYFTGIP